MSIFDAFLTTVGLSLLFFLILNYPAFGLIFFGACVVCFLWWFTSDTFKRL